MLGSGSPLMTDIVLDGGERMRIGQKVLFGFKVSESGDLPGELENVCRVDELSGPSSELFLSRSSPIGLRLDCEHTVNQYILIPAQGQFLTELDRKRRKMTSMSSSAENRVAADEILSYIDEVHRDSLVSVYSHLNILAWGPEESELELKGKVSAALSSMGVVAVQSKSDTPSLFLAGVPGGACEIGTDNLMRHELRSMLCLGLNETFERPLEGGLFRICDRLRNVPIDIDVQRLARDLGHIDNYNAFLLGPSGSGKSFFMNSFLRNCYDAGEHVFLIDVGDSYEGLCEIIREVSGGKDGMYYSWDPEHPFSFSPFKEIRQWLDESGHLRQDDSGVTFFISFLTTAWAPERGWTTDAMSILMRIVADFVEWAKRWEEDVPIIFNDFFNFVSQEVAPRIVPKRNKRGAVESMPKNPYLVGGGPVTPADFDVLRFLRAIDPYSSNGTFSFLLNDPEPKDLFESRFTVFEVDRLSQVSDKVFYSLCILCILHAFDMKMRSSDGFKLMVIEEAWLAIANETMAPYLRGLWKTARKFQTSAVVVTQQVSDIMSSQVIRDTILQNSSVRILLDQSNNRNSFSQLQ
ncbi:MAG: TraG family conjugative transposon ATPase, partial [Bacteroidales bacterium]|nr:TraG family conjugative transposon ATPase [Bacteroidales bacterium]